MSRTVAAASLACCIIRGGTSKGVFVREEQLPRDQAERDALLVALMGSPDPRQIDGLGGADPLTSKVAIIRGSTRRGIDVEYESVEVAIGEGLVNRGIMCGNLAAAVGAFAILEGLVPVQSPLTTVRILCRSNDKIVVARLPMSASQTGLPWDGAPGIEQDVTLSFPEPGGAVTGRLLPAGQPVSSIVLEDGKAHPVSIVDAGTLYAFAEAASLGVRPGATLEQLDGDTAFRERVELLREQVARKVNEHLGCALKARRIKIAIISAAGVQGADISARIINPAKVHKAYAVSGGICLAAAAAIPGTLVHGMIGARTSPMTVRIAHPAGVMQIAIRYAQRPGGIALHSAEIERKARVILRGNAFVPIPRPAADLDYGLREEIQSDPGADAMMEV